MLKEIAIPEYAEIVLNKLMDCGYNSYIVGGCVRDTILGLNPSDYDVTTDASPSDIKKIFKDYNIVNNNGERHGTITVMIKENQVEITTFRSHNSDPDILNDLNCRDFTINAIAYNKYGYKEAFGAISDLKSKIIRCVENPYDRFNEDPLRILRALRFGSTLGFDIEIGTKKAIFELKENLNNVSVERIQKEFNKIICGKNSYHILKEYRDVIAVFIPEIKITFDYDQMNKYHLNDLYIHTLNVVSNTKSNLETRLAAFFHDIGKPNVRTYDYDDSGNINCHYYNHSTESANIAKKVLKRLKYSNEQIDIVLFLIRFHDYTFSSKKKSITKLFNQMDECLANKDRKHILDLLIDLMICDKKDHIYLSNDTKKLSLLEIKNKAYELLDNNTCITVKDLKINGNDLINLGITGKEIGVCLNRLLDMVLGEKIENNKESLLNYVKKTKWL